MGLLLTDGASNLHCHIQTWSLTCKRYNHSSFPPFWTDSLITFKNESSLNLEKLGNFYT
jgi:hypothetical protein